VVRRTPTGVVVDESRLESAFRERWAELALQDLRERVRALAASDHSRAENMRTRMARGVRAGVRPGDPVAAMDLQRVRRAVDGFLREEYRAVSDRGRRSVLFDQLPQSPTPRQVRQQVEDLFTLWRYAIGDSTGAMEREGAKTRANYSQRIVKAFQVSVANARLGFRRAALDAYERLAVTEEAQRDAGARLDAAITAVAEAKARLDEATRWHESAYGRARRIEVEAAAAARAEEDAVRNKLTSGAGPVNRVSRGSRAPLRLVKSTTPRAPEKGTKRTRQT
jgi:hypothetical protein